MIRQGDVFWVDLGVPAGSGLGYLRPHVVIQNNVFNSSRIHTVVVCAVTSNLKRGQAPGNVMLRKGEANLPKPSVVNISQLYTVDKSALYDKIGTLSKRRMLDVIRGIQLLIEPRDIK
ncbi:MAG: mRNA interferase MazF2 [Candidatus Entotheonella factor]|uniref:mRNA interferase n=1 Tax=Entotheonella factor TaxID=1429438 RepID=W4LNN7_ENTF1|nr:MAG: mRNA interferase MazF2 [Candidatus Entotheonella factor]